MRSWLAYFVGGPLEGQLMGVYSTEVKHMVTSMNSSIVRTYVYRKGSQRRGNAWVYYVDRIVEEEKYQE